MLQGQVEDIIFQGTEEEVNSCALDTGKVPVVSGNTTSTLIIWHGVGEGFIENQI